MHRGGRSAADDRQGRVLALDWGTRRVGVALSDALGVTAQPLATLPAAGNDHGNDVRKLLEDIHRLCEQHNVTKIVVGIPWNMDGSAGPAAEAALDLARRLRQRLDIPVVEWDERLTSAAADRVLIQADVSRKRRRDVRDQLAAVLILQSYLDSRR